MQQGTRNPEPGTRNPEPGTRNPVTRWPLDGPTAPFQRRIVLAGSTVQALNRLFYDVEPLLAADRRLLVRYSLFHAERQRSGRHFARRHDIDLLDWATVTADPPDLIVASGATRTLHEPGRDVALIPHGAGHNRFTPYFDGVAGLARGQLRSDTGRLPAYLALPGPAAAERLAVDCPEALPCSEITGDLCFERLRLSARMRREYRRSLGIGPRKRLIAVSSTWLAHSLFGQHPRLPERLLEALPMDDYAVAFIPHPNILSVHGSIESLFRRQLENGLIMVDPGEGWRAALLAADAVIGDHGSVGFYAAALGIPTAVAAFGFDEMPAESPLAAFGSLAPRFDPSGDLLAQVEALCEVRPLQSECFGRALAEPDPGPSQRVRSGLYRTLNLDAAEGPGPRMFDPPGPVEHWRRTSAWRCEVDFDGDTARWLRFPADDGRRRAGHLVAEVRCLDVDARDRADIVIRHHGSLPEAEARIEARKLLREHPLATLASVRTGPGALVWECADGRAFHATCPPESADAAVSVWFAAGRPDSGDWRLSGPEGTLSVRRLR
ncbi:hypothetical protein [Glycomyces sp. NRRL B-16210]|uniref:hypothetical protein n=1 Tax=Glycomyces sp. NRRL B-16210 TaxID=1463821 RepID=UPI00068EE9DF|nr:hypothetical protein [Glycomyces sp. NRRL B-16210]